MRRGNLSTLRKFFNWHSSWYDKHHYQEFILRDTIFYVYLISIFKILQIPTSMFKLKSFSNNILYIECDVYVRWTYKLMKYVKAFFYKYASFFHLIQTMNSSEAYFETCDTNSFLNEIPLIETNNNLLEVFDALEFEMDSEENESPILINDDLTLSSYEYEDIMMIADSTLYAKYFISFYDNLIKDLTVDTESILTSSEDSMLELLNQQDTGLEPLYTCLMLEESTFYMNMPILDINKSHVSVLNIAPFFYYKIDYVNNILLRHNFYFFYAFEYLLNLLHFQDYMLGIRNSIEELYEQNSSINLYELFQDSFDLLEDDEDSENELEMEDDSDEKSNEDHIDSSSNAVKHNDSLTSKVNFSTKNEEYLSKYRLKAYSFRTYINSLRNPKHSSNYRVKRLSITPQSDILGMKRRFYINWMRPGLSYYGCGTQFSSRMINSHILFLRHYIKMYSIFRKEVRLANHFRRNQLNQLNSSVGSCYSIPIESSEDDNEEFNLDSSIYTDSISFFVYMKSFFFDIKSFNLFFFFSFTKLDLSINYSSSHNFIRNSLYARNISFSLHKFFRYVNINSYLRFVQLFLRSLDHDLNSEDDDTIYDLNYDSNSNLEDLNFESDNSSYIRSQLYVYWILDYIFNKWTLMVSIKYASLLDSTNLFFNFQFSNLKYLVSYNLYYATKKIGYLLYKENFYLRALNLFINNSNDSIYIAKSFKFFFFLEFFNVFSSKIEMTFLLYSNLSNVYFFMPNLFLLHKPYLKSAKLINDYVYFKLKRRFNINRVYNSLKVWQIKERSLAFLKLQSPYAKGKVKLSELDSEQLSSYLRARKEYFKKHSSSKKITSFFRAFVNSRTPLTGLRILITGPPYKARRKIRKYYHLWVANNAITGNLPLQSFDLIIDYYQTHITLKRATLGLRVWVMLDSYIILK